MSHGSAKMKLAAMAAVAALGISGQALADEMKKSGNQSDQPSAFGRSGNQGEGFSQDQTIKGPGKVPESSAQQDAQIMLGGSRPTVIGEVLKIAGDDYTIRDQSGSEVRIRVTRDTNLDCARKGGSEATMKTGRDASEHKEIPPTAHMQQQSGSQGHDAGQGGHKATGDQSGTQSRSTLGQDSGGDVARGSGFVVGSKDGCSFKEGDKVKAEVSDLGTALMLKYSNE